MQNYIQQAIRTESARYPLDPHSVDQQPRLINRVLHASMGLVTEAGEFQDALKKTLFYGKSLDTVNLKEELGDTFWYLAIACDALGVSFEEIQERNIAKLRARYPEKFSDHHAENRDLEKEREILEVCSGQMVHNLKTDPEVFSALNTGSKRFEIRKNDRNFQVGDLLILEETVHSGIAMKEGAPLEYTGRAFKFKVSYILHGPCYGLAEGWCILS